MKPWSFALLIIMYGTYCSINICLHQNFGDIACCFLLFVKNKKFSAQPQAEVKV
jgi:Gpi18-like mannosyltransferase